ncbi:yellowish-green 1 [Fusarium albosuccineum]|uniref:Yellowish-green 1 n=1 Tax=Fusarium albosuccineum TaxID=1237068 RepID=A0A8H4KWV3_9HYPO|nr:yellowish-green 1 [Fusarium albosuccineum]
MTPTQPYHVQALVDNAESFAFHRSVSATWNEKWKKLAHLGLYPFSDGKGEDFDRVFDSLIKNSGDDAAVFFDPDEYAKPFFPIAEDLVSQARDAEKAGDIDKAREMFLRAGAVYRIARFPINRGRLGQKAWELGKEAYLAASPYLSPPNCEVKIPHRHAASEAGESSEAVIGACVQIPEGDKPAAGWPIVLFICGLDAYRTDHSSQAGGKLYSHHHYGQALVIVDIPGTADSPAARNDLKSPDRLWSSVLEWIDENKDKYGFDTSRIIARGISTGGYYAMRIAHTHADRLLAVVAQGGASHHVFDSQWIRSQNHMEYPFALSDALAYKFGYKNTEDYINGNSRARFSLLENGIFDTKCTRLLLINGMEDSTFPIEDSFLALRHGRIKEASFVDGTGHMGAPAAEGIIRDWVLDALNQTK